MAWAVTSGAAKQIAPSSTAAARPGLRAGGEHVGGCLGEHAGDHVGECAGKCVGRCMSRRMSKCLDKWPGESVGKYRFERERGAGVASFPVTLPVPGVLVVDMQVRKLRCKVCIPTIAARARP